MSAVVDTAQPAKKAIPWAPLLPVQAPAGLTHYLAKKVAEAGDDIDDVRLASAPFPALSPLVETWTKKRLDQALKEAVHSATDATELRSASATAIEHEFHEAWDAAREIAAQVLEIPARKSVQVHAKAQTYLAMIGRSIIGSGDFTEEYRALVEAMLRDQRLALAGDEDDSATGDSDPDPTVSSTRAAWDSAKAAYDELRVQYRRAVSEADALYCQRLTDTAHPDLLEAGEFRATKLRWNYVEALTEEPLITDSDRERLKTLLAAHLKASRSSALEDQADAEVDRIGGLLEAAEDALQLTPAPDAAALLFKSRLVARELDDRNRGFDDLGLFNYSLHAAYDKLIAARQFKELLTLAGVDHPCLHIDDFNPWRWIEAYEATGGKVAWTDWDFWIVHPSFASPKAAERAANLRVELDLSPWKYRSVELAAKRRDPWRPDRQRQRLTVVDRVVFYDDRQHAPGSIADHTCAVKIDRVVLGSITPTEEDIAQAKGRDRAAMVACAKRSAAGRVALANLEAFDAVGFVDRVEAAPDTYFNRKGWLSYFEAGCLCQGPLHSRDAPAEGVFAEWRNLESWQKEACRSVATARPCWLEIEIAVERFMSHVSRSAGELDHDTARLVAIRDGRLTPEEIEIFDKRHVAAWIEAHAKAGGTLHLDGEGAVLMGGPFPPSPELERLRNACINELRAGVIAEVKSALAGSEVVHVRQLQGADQ